MSRAGWCGGMLRRPEVVLVGLDVGRVVDGEPHALEGRVDLAQGRAQWVQAAHPRAAGRKGEVDPLGQQAGLEGRGLDLRLAGLEGGGQRGRQRVDRRAIGLAGLERQLADALAQRRDGARGRELGPVPALEAGRVDHRAQGGLGLCLGRRQRGLAARAAAGRGHGGGLRQTCALLCPLRGRLPPRVDRGGGRLGPLPPGRGAWGVPIRSTPWSARTGTVRKARGRAGPRRDTRRRRSPPGAPPLMARRGRRHPPVHRQGR
jgi:hypothetical protein